MLRSAASKVMWVGYPPRFFRLLQHRPRACVPGGGILDEGTGRGGSLPPSSGCKPL